MSMLISLRKSMHVLTSKEKEASSQDIPVMQVLNHPLYNDLDKNLVLVYFNSEDYLTQFSLDTDWIKALAEVKKKLAE